MLALARFVGIEPKSIFNNLLNVGFDPSKIKLREQRGGSAASFGA
jgi:hypothetical protein